MDLHQLLVFGHIIGTALGVGGATVADLLFFRLLRNGTISSHEFSVLNLLRHIIMTGFLILFISGFGFLALVFINTGSLAGMPDKIIAKIVITFILGINSYFLSQRVMPLFRKNLGKALAPMIDAHALLIFTTGTISVISWYTTIILGSWRGLDASYQHILGVYAMILFSAVIGVQSIGIRLLKRYVLKKN